jgi:hypothetical protein
METQINSPNDKIFQACNFFVEAAPGVHPPGGGSHKPYTNRKRAQPKG